MPGGARSELARPRLTLATPALAVLALGAIACLGPPDFELGEEGGIPVARSHAPAWGGEDGWEIDARPSLRIESWGGASERPAPRLRDARRLEDGTIMIANAATNEVAWFDERGVRGRMVGGHGLLPGQFQSLHRLWIMGDTIWAFDMMGRWNVFGLDGRLLFTSYLEPSGAGWQMLEATTEAEALLQTVMIGGLPSLAAAGDAALERETYRLVSYERTGRSLGDVGTVLGRERFRVRSEGGISVASPLFGLLPVVHGGAGNFYVGDGAGMRIRVLSPYGRLERIIDVPTFDLSLDGEEWYVALVHAEQTEDSRFPTARHMRDLGQPATKPAYDRFVEDAVGNLWVGRPQFEYGRRTRTPPRQWVIFDPEGRWLGELATPEGLRVTEIGEDYVLGIVRTPTGGEVRLHALER